ncbi:MAG: hypothetical protein PHR53_06525 [Bacteroidales bacterium]|nr:hypothetical protein [Bacteroidales bacterium]
MNWKKPFFIVILCVFIVTLVILINNTKEKIVSEEYLFDEMVWERPNIVTLTIQVEKNMLNKPYDLFLELEHTIQIRKDKMLMDMEIIAPNQEERISTYNVWYKNNEGKFKGKSHENFFNLEQLLRKKFEFSQEGTWTFTLQQRSEFQYLQGIKSVQLVVKPSEKTVNNNQEEQ